MKIIATATSDLSTDQRMQRICSALSEAGYEVLLVGRELPTSRSLTERAFKQHRLRCRFTKGKAFYAEYNLRLFWFLLSQPFAVVNAVDTDTLLAAYAAARLRGKKVVLDAHEYFSEVPEVVDRPFTKWVWEAVARVLYPRVDAAYTVGATLAKVLATRYGIPFAVVRNVPFATPLHHDTPSRVGEETTANPTPATPYILLYQGALNAGRGLEALLNTMPLLPNCQLWIAGEGDLSKSLRLTAQRDGLSAQVTFLGLLTPDELHAVTQKAHIGLNLLEPRGLSYHYSLANKFFDYVQAEIPAIHPAFPEYLALLNGAPTSQGYAVGTTVSDLLPATIAAAVQQILHPKQYAAYVAACREAKAVWTWENEKPALLVVYETL